MPDGFQYPSGKGSDPHTEPQTHPDILSLFSILSDHDGQPNDDNITLNLMDGHTAVLPVVDHTIHQTLSRRRLVAVQQSKLVVVTDRASTPSSQSGQSLQSADTQEKRRTASRPILMLILFAAVCVGSYKLVQRESQQAVESTHHTCQLIAQTLLDQQNDDGGFSGIPQLPSAYGTCTEIIALAYVRCGIESLMPKA